MTESPATETTRIRGIVAVVALLIAAGLLLLELLTDIQWLTFAGQVIAAFMGIGQ
jgi:hypothetical protein